MPQRRRRSDAVQDNEEDWLVTYADAITLLMAFFVMLVSFSKVDLVRFEEVQAGLKGEIGNRKDEELTQEILKDLPLYNMQSKIQAIIDTSSKLPPGDVQVGFDDEGIVIDFVVGSFFEPQSVELTEPAQYILRQIYYDLGEPPYDIYFVDVEGHTDDVPISTPVFASNWELSAHQAASVVRFLIEEGMDPPRLQAAGYADTRPKLPPLDITGEPIPENRRLNRRIAIRLHP